MMASVVDYGWKKGEEEREYEKDEKLLSLGYQGQIYYSTRQILSRFPIGISGLGVVLSIGGGGICDWRPELAVGGRVCSKQDN